MDKIEVKGKKFKLFIPQTKIKEAVSRIAEEIKADIKQEEEDHILFVCILNGAFVFAAELMAEMNAPYEIEFAKYSSYSGTASTGNLKEILPITKNVKGRKVILLEDIVDTGFTMSKVIAKLKEAGAADVKLAVMLFKPESLKCDLKPDYVGLQIPPAFIVGHGLDFDGAGRAYRDIYVIDED